MEKWEKNKIKLRNEKNDKEKTRTQTNRLKVYKIGSQKKQTESN